MFWKPKEWPWPLKNDVEASLFGKLLQEEGIPYRIIRHGDSLWGYATEVAEGWGHLEVDGEFEPALDRLFHEFHASDSPSPEDVESEE